MSGVTPMSGTTDQILMVVEIALLVVVVIQGEFIRYYEREVHRIQSEREAERKAWREQKRKQVVKKAEKTEVSSGGTPIRPETVRVDLP
jgi:hypothetical protein